MNKLIIIGASGHGKVVADIAVKNGYGEIAFLDDNEHLTDCGGYPVVGSSGDFSRFLDADFIVAIGNSKIRERLQRMLPEQRIVTLVHPSAVIANHVILGKGTVVMAGVVINPEAVIGDGCIINTCSSVDHDCKIGDFVHVAVGSHVAGTVHIGSRSWIGAGATIRNNITICEDCMIGAGAVVVKDIQNPGIYIGVPAQEKSVGKKISKSSGRKI